MNIPNVILETDLKTRQVQTSGRLYFLAAALPTLVATFQACSQYDYFPSYAKMVTALLASLSAGVVALKAFKDGSYQKHQDLITPTPNTVDTPKV